VAVHEVMQGSHCAVEDSRGPGASRRRRVPYPVPAERCLVDRPTWMHVLNYALPCWCRYFGPLIGLAGRAAPVKQPAGLGGSEPPSGKFFIQKTFGVGRIAPIPVAGLVLPRWRLLGGPLTGAEQGALLKPQGSSAGQRGPGPRSCGEGPCWSGDRHVPWPSSCH
jgi:hypothetical protein